MALIDDTRAILQRLSADGWQSIFQAIGVDPNSQDLKADLLSPLVSVAGLQTIPGFEEIALDACSPICN